MEPLEIYDAINNKVIRVYVSTEVAEKCRTDTEFAHDLFNKLQDQDIEEGCAVEIETIKSEINEEADEAEPTEVEEYESPAEEKTDKEVWSRHETLKLIKVYQRYKDSFKDHKHRRVVWAMIAAELSQYNVFKSALKCAEKWKNLIRTYKVAKEKPNVPTRFQYYQEMKDILTNTEVLISDSEPDEKEVKYTPMSAAEVADLKDSLTEEAPEKESWSRYETLKFLKAFQMLKHMKQNFSKEKHFWAMVSAQLAKDNIHKHHEKCSAKWKNLLRSYRKNLEKSNINTPTRFHYFQEVNDVLNDTELEITDHMRITDDVEKIVDPDQFKTILEEAELETSKDPVSWAADETIKLIEAYKKHKSKFSKCSSKKFVWSLVSSELVDQGIFRDTEKVENKWKSLLRSYRKAEIKGENPRFYFYDLMCEALNDQKGITNNKENGGESLVEENSVDDTEMVLETSDHAYSENAGYEQIIIQTEPQETEESENQWSYSETSALLSAYANCKKFQNAGKSKLWEEVSKELKSLGMEKSGETCEKKWKKLFSVYKIHKLNKTGPGRFQFYQEIDDILKDELGGGETVEAIAPNKRCKCSEKRLVEKQNRHIERMQMLKRKLDLEERKVEAFELYVKHFKSTASNGSTS